MRFYEIRIILPLSLEEFAIGHVYARYLLKHRPTSRSNTETLLCSIYSVDSDFPGIYTHHKHTFSGYLPQWAESMLGGNTLCIHGKTWDEFPQIVSKYELPSMARSSIQIDTLHFDQDIGDQHNVFGLSPADLSNRTVFNVDILNDGSIPSPQSEQYIADEDPRVFQYSGDILPPRPKLTPGWRDKIRQQHQQRTSSSQGQQQQQQQQQQQPLSEAGQPDASSNTPYMCAYILLKSSFDLPLQRIRNHAYDLSTQHFLSLMTELHRLTYVWMGQWDRYISSFHELQQLLLDDALSNHAQIPRRPTPLLEVNADRQQQQAGNPDKSSISSVSKPFKAIKGKIKPRRVFAKL